MKLNIKFLGLFLLVGFGFVACKSTQEFSKEAETRSDVLYEDDFSPDRVGKWLTEGDELGTTAVTEGSMVIQIGATNTLQYTTLEEPEFTDFDLSVKVTLLDGSLDSSYGILFRIQGPSEFYRFEVTADGRYMIERLNGDSTWTRLVDEWIQSDSLITGLNATNQLRVVANGSDLSFWANGEMLQRIEDELYVSGKIGLDAGTFSRPGTKVAFDDLVVSQP